MKVERAERELVFYRRTRSVVGFLLRPKGKMWTLIRGIEIINTLKLKLKRRKVEDLISILRV